jgi:hypothetical protein
MKTLTEGGVNGTEVGEGGFTPKGNGANYKTKALVINNFTQGIVSNPMFDDIVSSYGSTSQSTIDGGLMMGVRLGKKLRTRQENNQLETNRLKAGKVDKRLIASIGYGADTVFKKIEIQNFKPAFLHISIDASGSMSGSKWNESIKTAVAIAKACDMVEGLECTISTRGTIDGPGGTSPATLIAYNSNRDSIKKIKTMFKYLNINSTTPEGLCFESILDSIEESNNGQDSYFINISDGAPYMSDGSQRYAGREARLHTKRQIQKMVQNGVKILSYFVTDYGDSESENFKEMYGKDAETIDMGNVSQIARTMNKLLMKKK